MCLGGHYTNLVSPSLLGIAMLANPHSNEGIEPSARDDWETLQRAIEALSLPSSPALRERTRELKQHLLVYRGQKTAVPPLSVVPSNNAQMLQHLLCTIFDRILVLRFLVRKTEAANIREEFHLLLGWFYHTAPNLSTVDRAFLLQRYDTSSSPINISD